MPHQNTLLVIFLSLLWLDWSMCLPILVLHWYFFLSQKLNDINVQGSADLTRLVASVRTLDSPEKIKHSVDSNNWMLLAQLLFLTGGCGVVTEFCACLTPSVCSTSLLVEQQMCFHFFAWGWLCSSQQLVREKEVVINWLLQRPHVKAGVREWGGGWGGLGKGWKDGSFMNERFWPAGWERVLGRCGRCKQETALYNRKYHCILQMWWHHNVPEWLYSTSAVHFGNSFWWQFRKQALQIYV